MKKIVEIYKQKYTSKSFPYYKNYLANSAKKPDFAVIIPACNEFPDIFHTVKSLTHADKQNFSILVVIVVNNTPEADLTIKENNRQLLFALQTYTAKNNFVVIDCASSGRELPSKNGVGLARKIGMDFAFESGTQILACMDADTIVDQNYFEAIFSTFTAEGISSCVAGVTTFVHQKAENKIQQKIISAYENYLKDHSKKLHCAGFPYFPIALGPTIVCTSLAYANAGGMNTKCAGEDFYFLQRLIKSTILAEDKHFLQINTAVHPSARISFRVPFGTGKIIDCCIKKHECSFGFAEENYRILHDFLQYMKIKSESMVNCNLETETALIHPALANFLIRENFYAIWKNLVKNNKSAKKLYHAFLIWFDGLKLIQLFHAFADFERK